MPFIIKKIILKKNLESKIMRVKQQTSQLILKLSEHPVII